MVKNHAKKHGANKKCQKMEIIKTQNLNFSQKNAPKNTTFKTSDRRILGQGSTKTSIKTTGQSLGSTTTFCLF